MFTHSDLLGRCGVDADSSYFVTYKTCIFSLTDFLQLKKAYIGNEQQLVEMQEQYFILQQSYQKLQQDSQDQLAQLVEKLEKSYDAYNEKFMKVEELEEKLNKFNRSLEEVNQHNENKV